MKYLFALSLLLLGSDCFCFAELPLKIIPAVKESNSPMVFMISGDGGWNSFDQAVAESLAAKGIPVVGLDAQKYFWDAKMPAVFTPEISRSIELYMERFHKKSFTLIGYSFGASVSTFLASNFSADLKDKSQGIFFLSPDEKADFEIHIMDMLSFGSKKDIYDVLAEMKKIRSLHPVCIFGTQEDTAMKDRFKAAGATIINLPGNHHYNNNYQAVADNIVRNIPKE